MATNLNGTQAYRFELFEPQQAMPCLLYTSDAADE